MFSCGRDYPLGQPEPSGIPVRGIVRDDYLPRNPSYASHNDARQADKTGWRPLAKPHRSKRPAPPLCKALVPIPAAPKTDIITPTVKATGIEIPPAMAQKPSIISMEPTIGVSGLALDRILKLQARYEGVQIFPNVSPKELADWQARYPELIENPKIRLEYNFLSESLVIKCMALPTHDTLQEFFNGSVRTSLNEKIGVSETLKRVTIASGTSFTGFKGDWTGSSEKLPDAYVQLADTEFPRIVCEAGWSEKHIELMQDARLWLLHTAGETCLVIILSFTESTPENALLALDVEVENPTGSEGGQSSQDEQTVIDSIDEATNQNDLAKKLFELNQASQLSRPLVRKLGAIIYGYRASEDGLDIVPSFQETLLPRQEADGGISTDFPLTMKDLLGESLPEGQDPEERITLSLATLVDFIERSIPRTEHFRAARRAKALLRKAGVWEEEETFAQCKRRRLNRS